MVPGSQWHILKIPKVPPQKNCRPIHLAASPLICVLDKQNHQLLRLYFYFLSSSIFACESLVQLFQKLWSILSLVQVLLRLLFTLGTIGIFSRRSPTASRKTHKPLVSTAVYFILGNLKTDAWTVWVLFSWQ